jgi:hypothetical protein
VTTRRAAAEHAGPGHGRGDYRHDTPHSRLPAACAGRYYVIRPEVRNSTGHPQLGGDYLTLRVFHWLKAAIVDALLDGPGHERERAELRKQVLLDGTKPEGSRQCLAEAIVTYGGIEEPVPAGVKEKLRAILPTDWRGRPDVRRYQPARPIARLRRHFGEQYWLESEYRLNEIPAAILGERPGQQGASARRGKGGVSGPP